MPLAKDMDLIKMVEVKTKTGGGVKHGGGEVETTEQPASKFLRVPPLPMGMDEEEKDAGKRDPVHQKSNFLQPLAEVKRWWTTAV